MSKNSKFVTATVDLDSTKGRPCFAKDAVSLMQEQVQSQDPRLCKEEVVLAAAKAAIAAVGPSVQSLAASVSALQGEVAQLTQLVGHL